MINRHPTFPNPTINEALCEIYFALPKEIAWEPSVYGKFYALIQEEFPLIEPVAGANICMRYHHQTKPLLFQLSQSIFTVNFLAKYPGWQQMRQDILSGWSSLRELLGPAQPTRIGLRYINFVPVRDENDSLKVWFAPNPYVALAVLESRPSISVVDVRITDQTRAIVQVGELANLANQSERRFYLDIDAITVPNQNSLSALADVITDLHDNVVWKIFDNFRTPKLDELLIQE